jgi:hypothetical protein
MPPDADEIGWKDTVRVNPDEIATVIMKFDLPDLPTAAMRKAVKPEDRRTRIRVALPHS